ncbi:MAG: hypothetical protein QM650_17450, partial [Microlunatus sp.]
MTIDSTDAVRSVVLVTATETEPRSFGKQVVVGGILDHLCARLGPENVHVVLVGRPGQGRPETPYRLHVIAKPGAARQAWSVLTRSLGSARAPLQESALWSPKVESAITERLATIGADLEIWDTMRVGQYA